MGFVIFISIVIVLALVFSGYLFHNNDPLLSLVLSSVGVLALMVVIALVAPVELSRGMPKKHISAGGYRVASVYVAGDNVSVWVESMDDDKTEHLIFYQFNKKAFGGEIKIEAKKLVVVESGDFKKLQLE